MANQTINPVFDGVNDVERTFGRTSEWDNGFLGYYSAWGGSDDVTANVSIAGSNWRVRTIQFDGEAGYTTTIDEEGSGTGRVIEYLLVGGDLNAKLRTTRVEFMSLQDGDHVVTLGDQRTNNITAFGNSLDLRTGTGYLASLESFGATTVRINGDVGSIMTDEQNDTIIANAGFTEFVKTKRGDDSVTVKSGATISSLKMNDDGNGTKTVNVTDGGRINFLTISNAENATVTMTDSGRIRFVDVFSGNFNITTGTAFVTTINTWESKNSIHVGTGGVAGLFMGSETLQAKHTVTAEGWIGAMRVFNMDRVDLTLGDGGASSIRLGDDRDVVKTGSGFVDLLHTGDGKDTVILNGAVERVVLGDGNDVLKVVEIPNLSVNATGRSGTDTFDFGRFTVDVTFSLNLRGQYQNVAEPGNFESGVAGFFAATNFENLKGGRGNDTLEGNGADNKMIGGAGNDTIDGLEGRDNLNGGGGNDRLIGGADNDLLRGAGGADVFVVGADAGNDRVKDFVQGTDSFEVADHVGGFAALNIFDDGADRMIEHDGGSIRLLGSAGLVLTDADFDFV